ncbi:CatB-related O-acetyltransferase [Leisingera sp. XS_AS12]|uniref:CatB-related O-acetyltransferase n=1 Tax=Leisingera sp. XS_AS12 TaxID=3241294 RepID=UPI00351460BB
MVSADSFKTAPIGDGTLEIGRFTHGYEDMSIRGQGGGTNVSIGSFCTIGEGVQILMEAAPQVECLTAFPFGAVFAEEMGGPDVHPAAPRSGDVVIGNDVWIGANATLLAGVTIGDGAVIGPNSTVTEDIGAYEVWGGNPAQRMRKRFDEAVCAKLQRLRWWDLPVPLIREMTPLLTAQPTVELIEGLQSIVDDLVTFSDDAAA